MVAAPIEFLATDDWTCGRGQGTGRDQGRGLARAGPGAGLSLLVKRQQPSRRHWKRGAACPPARPGADPGVEGKGVSGSGLGSDGGVGDPGSECKRQSLKSRGPT